MSKTKDSLEIIGRTPKIPNVDGNRVEYEGRPLDRERLEFALDQLRTLREIPRNLELPEESRLAVCQEFLAVVQFLTPI